MLFQCLLIKENHFWDYTFRFHRDIEVKKYESLLSTFRNNSIPSRKTINELLKIYPKDLFGFDYFEQYCVSDTE